MTTSKFAFADIQILLIALVMSSGSTCDEAIREIMGASYDASKHTPENYAHEVMYKIHAARG
jgi:hypothetical protein